MTEEERKLIELEMKRLFPEAVAVQPGPDGSCPMCEEMGLDHAAKAPQEPGVFSVFLHARKPRPH